MGTKYLISVFLCLLLLTGCRKPEEPIQTNWVLEQENAFILSDGTAVDIWQLDPLFSHWDYYRLENGTNLLVVEETLSPLQVSVGYLSLQDLPEKAQSAICNYYENQGLLYDLEATLEKAYAEYCDSEETGEVFTGYRLHQQSSPCSLARRSSRFSALAITAPPLAATPSAPPPR